MKSLIIIGAIMVATMAEAAPVYNMDQFIAALIQVESSGNDKAVNGDCLGPLQLSPGYVEDVNRIYATNFTHEDAFNRKLAICITGMYLAYYVTPERFGRPVTWEDMARCHRSGYKGRDMPRATEYWHKVQAEMGKHAR